MELGNKEENINTELNRYKFLTHPLSREVFAETDYLLKSGCHIQKQHPKQKRIFEFITESDSYLDNFYRDFYDVSLEYRNEDLDQRYYFISFFKDDNERYNRGNIRLSRSEYLEPQHVIVGLFLWYINNADYVDSITEVQKMLDNDYDELKDGFYKLFAKVSDKKYLNADRKLVNKTIENALLKFGEIGWLYFPLDDNNKFEIMPSFDRLTHVFYADAIENFEKLFKSKSKDE
ncbi:hypothetical protein [Maribellus maritimus]|uniref:hypothetical protein n=1 Tax=Maribellus maritimus TaxID=2870838 RepID=UPI001EEB14B5|nr:hypothetical protein [Maribellus maritimus]MCG6189856.1 hypothetical protein [Maribellus maritimus]